LKRIVLVKVFFVNLERREGLLYVIASGDNNKNLSDFWLSS